MSILGGAVLVAGIAGLTYVGAKLANSKFAKKHPILAHSLIGAGWCVGIVAVLIGGQMAGINMGTWVMHEGQYLVAPGGL